MRLLEFTIPGEPVAKGRPRMTRQGRAYTPQKTVNYETLIKECFAVAYPDHQPLTGPLGLKIDAHFTIPASWSQKKQLAAQNYAILPTKRPDVDNLIKCMDALNGIAWRDDSQIVSVLANKFYSTRPRLEIEITEVDA